ncbi:hypothetical protein [Brevundimonas sp.]|uniref:hypothetical protein n=1 Tax=Brevundimonas sp. TaxID=1871086 RepID=UPI0035B0AF5E
MRPIILALAALLAAGPTLAQEPAAEPPLIDRAVNNPRVSSWTVYGPGLSHQVIEAEVQGGQALQVEVTRAGANPWDVAAQAFTADPIAAGDVMLLGVWLRSDTSGATVNIRLQGSDAPYPEIAAGTVSPGSEWKLWFAQGRADQAFVGGRANASVQLAGAAQTVELGPVFIFDFGPDYDVERLPTND